MEQQLQPQPTQPRTFTGTHRAIILSWAAVWSCLMALLFFSISSQDTGWFDGPEFAALFAGFGLAIGLAVLGIVVAFVRLAIRDNTIRSLTLLVAPPALLVLAFVAL